MSITVLIADDQDLVREGLRMLLQAEPGITVIGEAGTGTEAIAAARKLDPDVVLMDIRMPGRDGIEAAAHLARPGSRAKILMLTTHDLDEYVYRAMRAGASGFPAQGRQPRPAGHRGAYRGGRRGAPGPPRSPGA
jgi:DNA-binding NarL/FixJ family response regulator